MMMMTCMMYQDYPQWGVDWSNNRRGYHQTVALCEEYGGHLPYSLQGSEPSQGIGAEWHWLNYPPVGSTCLAIRPERYQEGAAYFPCEYKFSMACEQDTAFPLPMPSYPRIVRMTNSTLYNYNYQPCPMAVNSCKGRWGMQDRKTRLREILAMAAMRNPYLRFALGLGRK